MEGIAVKEADKAALLTALSLFKADLGIRGESRDEYFAVQLLASLAELADKGIAIDQDRLDDNLLLADYTAWRYRMRMEDSPAMSDSLRCRIRNRIVKRRAQHEQETPKP